MKYDVETFFFELQTQIKAQLNSKITAINTEKADTVLATINNDAWIGGSLNEEIKNYDDFVFFYIDDIQAIVNGPIVAKTIVSEFDLCIAQSTDFLDYKRILRYQRALEEAAITAWNKVGQGYDKATITLLNPIDVKLFNGAYWHKVIGIQIEFNLIN